MEKYAGTQAVARTFQLINLFDDQSPVWTLPDLIEASQLKRTTVFRLLSALEAEGIVRKTEEGDYTLGPTLILYGGRAIRSNRLRAVALPHLKELVRQTGESVTIDVLWVDEEQRPMSMVIEEQLGQHLLGMSQYIGARVPAHATSTGKVLLAFQPKDRLEQITHQPLARFTDKTIQSRSALLESLTEIRSTGYAMTQSELEIGLCALATPIFNHHGEASAALCIAGPQARMRPKLKTLIQTILTSGRQISEAMGAPHDLD